MTATFVLKVLILALNMALLGVAAFGLTLCTRPNRPATWIAGGVISSMAVVIVVSEAVGRLAYKPLPLTLGMAIAALSGAMAIYQYRGRLPRLSWPKFKAKGGMLAVICVALTVWSGAALWMFAGHVILPPFAADALVYHVTGPAFWVSEGYIGKIEGADMRINFFPHNMSLLWGWTLALTRGDYLGGIFPVLTVFLLWPVTVYLIATHFGAQRDASLVFSILSGATSVILMQGMNEGVDVLFWAAALLALFAAFAGEAGYGRLWLAVGIAAGLTLGTKVYGVVTGSMVLMSWFGISAYRVYTGDGKWLPFVWQSLCAGLVALTIGGWVLVENTLIYGNPIFPYPFIIDFAPAPELAELFRSRNAKVAGMTALDALRAVMASTPHLLLGLAPLDGKYGPYSSGFGYMSPTILLTVLGLALAAIARAGRGLSHIRVLPWLGFSAILLAVHILLASKWGLLLISDLGAGYTSAGRYQIFWAALTAVLAALLFPRTHRWRALAAVPALIVFICVIALSVENGNRRNWNAVRTYIGLFPDRLAQIEGLHPRITPELATTLRQHPQANLLEFSRRSLIYPYFYPSFDRYVHTRRGFDMGVPPMDHWTFSDSIYRAYDAADWRAVRRCARQLPDDHSYLSDDPRTIASILLMKQIIAEQNIELILQRPSAPDVRSWLHTDPAIEPLQSDRDSQAGETYLFKHVGAAKPLHDSIISCLREKSEAYQAGPKNWGR